MDPSLQSLLEDCGYETDTYSGRGMGGKECLCVITDNSVEKVVAKVSILFSSSIEFVSMEDKEVKDFVRMIASVRSDRMGRDNVYYWPTQQWVEPEESTPSEDDDSGNTDDCD